MLSPYKMLWTASLREGSVEDVLAAVYDAEINTGMQAFWDCGWTVWIGDGLNGRAAEHEFHREDMDQIAAWLFDTAERLYPVLASARPG